MYFFSLEDVLFRTSHIVYMGSKFSAGGKTVVTYLTDVILGLKKNYFDVSCAFSSWPKDEIWVFSIYPYIKGQHLTHFILRQLVYPISLCQKCHSKQIFVSL